MKVLLIGNGGREHALAETVVRAGRGARLFAFMKSNNPGIAELAEDIRLGSLKDTDAITEFARLSRVDLALVGPEEPLSHGVVDALRKAGVLSVGPSKSLARLETSKTFTRDLLEKYSIPGNIRFRSFTSPDGIGEFLSELDGAVIKPDGLTGGKGVLVQGEHFFTGKEAQEACLKILAEHSRVIIEEKLEGEEFSLQCFTDGNQVVAMPPVQDHKRRFPEDRGPNTGGMGSYSDANHLLPFLNETDVARGLAITRQVAAALKEETGEDYRGIMYGGFMATGDGVRLLEYNARFGDPEAMNVLPLLTGDFTTICEGIVSGTLEKKGISFAKKATVCKYVVPKDYGLPPGGGPSSGDLRLEIGATGPAKVFFSAVEKKPGGLYLTSSRAIGLVGIADTLEEAERIAEEAARAVTGWVDHRRDIGTRELITKRITHLKGQREAKGS